MSGPVKSRARAVLLALVLAPSLAAGPAQALETDQEQPIRISADQALRDEKQGFTVYRGNVRMDQGSLQIEADSITIYHTAEEADRIVARGKPARMQQQPDPTRGPVHARAAVIEYFKSEERVHLREDAHIEQDGSTGSGETIDYFIREQRVRADSNQGRDGSRVEVLIPAQQVQNLEDRRGDTDGQ